MKDHIFISYKREEKDFANRVRAVLALATKADIWWDEDLQAGGKWNEDLDEALRDAGCVVVIWSRLSVQSDWVKQEASFAKYAGTILPVLKEPCEAPIPFQSIQTVDLRNWSGSERDPEFVKVVERARALIASRKRRAARQRRSFMAMGIVGLGLVALGFGGQALVGWRPSPVDSKRIPSAQFQRLATAVRDYQLCAEQEPKFVCRPEADALAGRSRDIVEPPEQGK